MELAPHNIPVNAEEMAHFVAKLLHAQGGFMTGQTLHIDGGLTISAAKIG